MSAKTAQFDPAAFEPDLRAIAEIGGEPLKKVRAEFDRIRKDTATVAQARQDRERKREGPGIPIPSVEDLAAGIAVAKLKQRLTAGGRTLFSKVRASYVPGAARIVGGPWESRPGWETEPALPILTKDDERSPQEPGYVTYNELVGEFHFRPFRTTTGEPRAAFPTRFGVEVRDPSAQGFVDAVGYRFWTLDGEPVPRRNLSSAAQVLTQRALARELQAERIVDLSIRVAPDGQGGSLLDLADRERRCVHIAPAGWTLETVGYPIFDTPSHLAELPEPLTSEDPEEGRKRYGRFFEFVNLPPSSADGADPRLLIAAAHVQFLIAPGTPKPVVALIAEEGAGKTEAAQRLQELVDPSKVRSLGAPESPKELAEWAYNRATINLDNLSRVTEWLSDGLARLCTGAGLAKRQLFTDRGEVIARRTPWILFNGITPTPHHADLIRRAIFPELERPGRRLSLSELEEKWRTAHPEILGGLLDLAALTLSTLRDPSPSASPSADSMADYVRIGRAVAVAMGRGNADFDRAWAHNVEKQGAAAAENPWVGVLFGQLEKQAIPVSVSELALRISTAHRETWPKGVSVQQVGNELARCKLTLEKMGLLVVRRMLHGTPQYFRQISESGSPGSPIESFSDEKRVGEPQGEPRVNLLCGLTQIRGEPEIEAHPRSTQRFSGGRVNLGEQGEPTLKVPGTFGGSERPSSDEKPAEVPSYDGPVVEEPGNWTVPAKDRARGRAEREGEP